MADYSTQTTSRPFVLHVRSATGVGGGPEKTILNSPRFLGPLGYDAACAYLHHEGDGDGLRRRAEQAGAPFLSVPDRGRFDVTLIVRLARLCRQKNVSIWHGHDYKTDVLGLLVRPFWPMKLVSTVHGWGVHGRLTPLYYRLDKFALRFHDAVICVSDDIRAECLRAGVAGDCCHLVHNAIDIEEFCPRERAPGERDAEGPRSTRIVLGTIGRLSPEKNFTALIEATAGLIGRGCDVELRIAGEGPARPELEQAVHAHGCDDRIRLLGHVAEVKEFLHALDLFVLSSLREGLPNVLLEAMACGVPVVATRIAGVPSLVEDGVSGLLVEPGSTEELAKGIRALLEDPARRLALAQAARYTIERSFGFQERMRQIAGVYDGVLATHATEGESLYEVQRPPH